MINLNMIRPSVNAVVQKECNTMYINLVLGFCPHVTLTSGGFRLKVLPCE